MFILLQSKDNMFKEFFENNKVWIAIAISVVVVGLVCALIALIVMKKKSKDNVESFVEGYIGSDEYTDQFKYAESYISSVLGV